MNEPDLESMSTQEIIDLVKLGITFKSQQKDKKLGFLQCLINNLVKSMPHPSFNNLLYALECEAVKRNKEGENANPVENLDRVWWVFTYHSKHGRTQINLDTLRNKLTLAKKNKA